MNILVMGCNGMAGHMISLFLSEQGHAVTGFARKKILLPHTILGDATDLMLVHDVIARGHFDCVINCIGILNQAAEDHKNEAVFLNAFFPHYLAEQTKGLETKIVHISTDCVFSGRRGQYKEHDFRDGETFYDRSKALGELEDQKNLTIRTSIVGPDMNPKGIGLINWFMQQDGAVKGYTKAIWTGMTTLQLAKTIETAIKQQLNGLHNFVPKYSINKFELLSQCNQYLRAERIYIDPDESVCVDKSLVCEISNSAYKIPDYSIMLSELHEWMLHHHALYPHYKLYGKI